MKIKIFHNKLIEITANHKAMSGFELWNKKEAKKFRNKLNKLIEQLDENERS